MPAIRRTALHGDAWYPFGSNPKFRMDKIETYAARLTKLHQVAEAAGRDPATIAQSYNCAFHSDKEQPHVDSGRQLFTGSPQQRAEDISALAETGVTTMIVNVASNDKSEMLGRMAEFAENVHALGEITGDRAVNSFGAKDGLQVHGDRYTIWSLPKAEAAGLRGAARLPYSLQVFWRTRSGMKTT